MTKEEEYRKVLDGYANQRALDINTIQDLQTTLVNLQEEYAKLAIQLAELEKSIQEGNVNK